MHVRDLGMACERDEAILKTAAGEGRVLVSRDAGISGLLVQSAQSWPSFVLLRTPGLNDPEMQARLIAQVLDQRAQELENGAIVTVQHDRVRVRSFPANQT